MRKTQKASMRLPGWRKINPQKGRVAKQRYGALGAFSSLKSTWLAAACVLTTGAVEEAAREASAAFMAGLVETGAVITGCADEANAMFKVGAIFEAGAAFRVNASFAAGVWFKQ